MKLLVSLLLVSLLLSTISAQARKSKRLLLSKHSVAQDSEPPLVPLTEEEAKLELRKILLGQPDFMADESFFDFEGHGGFSAKRRVVRQGNRQLIDTGFVKILTEPGKEIRLNDASKTYEEIPIRDDLVLANGRPLDVHRLARQDGVRLTALGTQIVEGHKCLKIEAKLDGQPTQVFLYAAADLKYLVIAVRVLKPPRSSMQRLENISLNVPHQLLEIPSGYKPLPKFKWSRVDSAQVSYDGKPQKEFSVFRSEDQRQLYVTVEEPHPNTGLPLAWHYVVYLPEQKVEIGYQGMLLTKQGDLAWTTTATEAISNGENRPKKDWSPCRSKQCPKTIVGASSAQFASVYYEDRKSVIHVSW